MSIYDHYTMLRLGLGPWSSTQDLSRHQVDRGRAEEIRRAREEQAWREAKLESSEPDD